MSQSSTYLEVGNGFTAGAVYCGFGPRHAEVCDLDCTALGEKGTKPLLRIQFGNIFKFASQRREGKFRIPDHSPKCFPALLLTLLSRNQSKFGLLLFNLSLKYVRLICLPTLKGKGIDQVREIRDEIEERVRDLIEAQGVGG